MSDKFTRQKFQDWLPAAETRFLRLLNRAAGVLILMLRLCRPVTASQAGALLDLHPQTVTGHFHTLQMLGLACPDESGQGFRLASDLLGPGTAPDDAGALSAAIAKLSRCDPITTTTTTTKDSLIKESDLVVIVDPERENIAPALETGADPEVLLALRQARISEPKRSALARLPGMTAKKVRLWEKQLRQNKGSHYSEGLLIYVLESDLPEPPSRPNGHLQTCTCDDCRRFAYDVCLFCFSSPCQCEWDDPQEGDVTG